MFCCGRLKSLPLALLKELCAPCCLCHLPPIVSKIAGVDNEQTFSSQTNDLPKNVTDLEYTVGVPGTLK